MAAFSSKRLVSKWVCVDGVLAPTAVSLPKLSRRISFSGIDQPFSEQHIHCRDPFHSVLEMSGSVYVVGGTRTCCEGCLFSRSLLRYDPQFDKCTNLSDMNVRRGDFVACSSGNRIYVFGGRNRHGILDLCEMYDSSIDKWQFIAKLPEARYMAAGVSLDGQFYVSGGFNDREAKGTMLRYNPERDEWSELDAPMMAERGYHVMIKGPDERLWVIGGVDSPFAGSNVWEIEAFDPKTEMWQFMGQVLPNKLFKSTVRLNALVDKQGEICIFAVTDPDKSPKLRYNMRKRAWSEVETIPDLSELDVDM